MGSRRPGWKATTTAIAHVPRIRVDHRRRDLDLLEQSTEQLESVTASLQELAAAAPWRQEGYFNAPQHATLEHLFFRFVVSRQVLASFASSHAGDDGSEDEALFSKRQRVKTEVRAKIEKVRAKMESAKTPKERADADETTEAGGDPQPPQERIPMMIALAASLAMLLYESRLVVAFGKDPIAVAKLNEGFYRSDIPRDAFRSLSLGCKDTTPGGRVESLERAVACYLENNTSDLNDIESENVEHLSQLISSLHRSVQRARNDLLGGSAATVFRTRLMSLENTLQQTKLADTVHRAKNRTRDKAKEIRAHTYKSVSRLKAPTAYLIQFTQQQKRRVLDLLQPGDLVFTYTAGYMSSVFIPGVFKHGITYIGSPSQRGEAGLTEEGLRRRADAVPEGEMARLLEDFEVSTIEIPASSRGHRSTQSAPPTITDADCIEAVAEGVVFGSLSYIMDTHVNRLLVLRPNITFEERTDALIDIFRYLGVKYDFGFDFSDSSAVVCTEIIYHAFAGKGGLNLELREHAGHLSLSADDIVEYYLEQRQAGDGSNAGEGERIEISDGHPPEAIEVPSSSTQEGGAFSFVLLATENLKEEDRIAAGSGLKTAMISTDDTPPTPRHNARIQVGEEGVGALVDVMAVG